MKTLLILPALLLTTVTAMAGTGYDTCIKEEKELIEQEKSRCSGLSNLLNPSGCFATQKLLKEYKAGKCRRIASAENVDLNVQPVVTEKRVARPPGSGSAASIRNESSAPVTGAQGYAAAQKTEAESARQESELERLKAENARLNGEVSRLRSENEQLRKTGR